MLKYFNAYSTSDTNKLGIKTSNGIIMINKFDIIFAEIFGKELIIKTKEENISTKLPLQTLLSQLPAHDFIQITKSSIINIQFIKKISPSFSGNFTAKLMNGEKVSISRRYVKNLNHALNI